MAKLCVYAPMKDEVNNVLPWCESARSIGADQIIILDTGSTDGTRKLIQEQEGVELYISKNFDKDTKRGDFKFDVARNEALDESKCDWNIAVDADERVYTLQENYKSLLDEVLPTVDLVMCPVKMLDDAGNIQINFMGERLFRNTPEVRYVGAMHNYINVPNEKRVDREWLEVRSCRDLRSHEARAERGRQRIDMAETFFKPKIMEDPNDTRSMFYLARTYREDNQPDRAIYWYRRYLKKGTWSDEIYQAATELAGCLRILGEPDSAFDVMVKYLKYDIRRAEGFIILGDICYGKGDNAQAVWWYKLAAACEWHVGKMFLTKTAYSWSPYDKMSMAQSKIQQFTNAYNSALKALEFDDLPDGQRARIKKNTTFFKPRKGGASAIMQVRVSKAISFFGDKLKATFELQDYVDPNQPALFYGCYPKVGDIEAIAEHKGLAVVVWCGSDSTFIGSDDTYGKVMEAPHVRHVATSAFIMNDLSSWPGIEPIYLPIFVGDSSRFRPIPLGNKVYFYGNKDNEWLYNTEIFREVKEAMPDIEFVERYAPLSEEEQAEDVFDLYAQCFAGLRLTNHDGVSHTSIELGLMGRRCIWNGCLPNAIPWVDTSGIIDSIRQEQALVSSSIRYDISDAVKRHIELPEDWLLASFWG